VVEFACERLAISTLPPRDATAMAAAFPIPEEPPTTMAESGLAAQQHEERASASARTRLIAVR